MARQPSRTRPEATAPSAAPGPTPAREPVRAAVDPATAALVIDIASAAAGEADLETILFETLDRLQRLVSFTGGSIAVVDGDDLVVRAAVGPFASEALGSRVRRGANRTWQVVETREPYVSNDLAAAGRRVRTPRAGAAVQSWLGVPLIRHGEGIGLLEVDSTRRNAFDERDVDLMEAIARVLAGPVDLALRHEAERRAGQIRDAFVGIISHELRTPITTIFGDSKLLRRHAATLDADTRDQLVADIEAEADRLQRLVEDLLVLSRAEQGRIVLGDEPLLVAHVVRRAVRAAESRYPTHRFVLDVAPGLPAVRGEETYLEQVVGNLLANAVKYSAADTTVRIAVGAHRDDGGAQDGGAEVVEVTVADDGVGIEPLETTRLFELFYRSPNVARTAKGAGIGLFVCRTLVEAMGGRISAQPAPGGRGSVFAFRLPAYDLEPEPSEEVEPGG